MGTTTIHLLEVSIVLVFFANKVLILNGKRFGWLLGIIAGIFAIVYFYSQGKIPMAGLQVGIVGFSTYGFLLTPKKKIMEWPLRILIGFILLSLVIFTFTGTVELLKSLVGTGLLLGNYFLARVAASRIE